MMVVNTIRFGLMPELRAACGFNPVARTIAANEAHVERNGRGTILVIAAGTSDIPVAAEAVPADVPPAAAPAPEKLTMAARRGLSAQARRCAMKPPFE